MDKEFEKQNEQNRERQKKKQKYKHGEESAGSLEDFICSSDESDEYSKIYSKKNYRHKDLDDDSYGSMEDMEAGHDSIEEEEEMSRMLAEKEDEE